MVILETLEPLGVHGWSSIDPGRSPPPWRSRTCTKIQKKVSDKILGTPFGAILSHLEANGSFGKGFFGSKLWSIFSMDFWPVFDLFLEVFSKVFQLVFYSFFSYIRCFFLFFFHEFDSVFTDWDEGRTFSKNIKHHRFLHDFMGIAGIGSIYPYLTSFWEPSGSLWGVSWWRLNLL